VINTYVLSAMLIALVSSASTLFAQTGPVQRINQAIIVNGQRQAGVTIVQDGRIVSQVCPYPQEYVTEDQASSGWTCFEPATGTWLLHALPPQETNSYDQSSGYPVVTPPAYSYYTYPYPYTSYYPDAYYPYSYSYPYFWGPTFGVGFGFGR
jgi:hypothetical protein